MSFEGIMKEITVGLTGDEDRDMEYLKGQLQKYKDHEFKTEIIRAISRMMFEMFPEDSKKQLATIIKRDFMSAEAVLEEARYCVYKKEFEKALSLLEGVLPRIEALEEICSNDTASEYYCFTELFQEILHRQRSGSTKNFRPASPVIADTYFQLGSLMIDLKRPIDAREYLQKAIRWNPTYSLVQFEYAETFKTTGEFEEFMILTREAFKIAFRPDDVARCYRNMGYYFTEKQLYAAAQCCFLLSLEYNNQGGVAQSELYYISQLTGEVLKDINSEQMESYCEQYDIPRQPDKDVVGLAYSLGDHLKQKNPEVSKYLFEIVYGLTRIPEILTIIETLGGKLS